MEALRVMHLGYRKYGGVCPSGREDVAIVYVK